MCSLTGTVVFRCSETLTAIFWEPSSHTRYLVTALWLLSQDYIAQQFADLYGFVWVNFYLPPANAVWGKVMFSRGISLSRGEGCGVVERGGGVVDTPPDPEADNPPPWTQSQTPTRPRNRHPRTQRQTPPIVAFWCGLLVERGGSPARRDPLWWTSGRYASYWNVFLF